MGDGPLREGAPHPERIAQFREQEGREELLRGTLLRRKGGPRADPAPRTPHLELRGPRPRRERSRDGRASPPLLKRVLTAAPRWQSAVPILPRRLPTGGAACALGTRGSTPLRRSCDGSARPRSPAWAPAPHAPSALSGFSSLRGSVWPHLNTR